MHSPSLSVRTSEAHEEVISVHYLLDHTWHYECVVSPTIHHHQLPSKPIAKPPLPASSKLHRQHPQISTEYVSLASFINSENSDGRTLRFDSFPCLSPSQSPSASFSSSSSSAAKHSRPSKRHDQTKCNVASRGRESRVNFPDSSRISFYAGFMAVD